MPTPNQYSIGLSLSDNPNILEVFAIKKGHTVEYSPF
jgi:hypothetical protein